MMPWFSDWPSFHGFGGMFMIFFWVMLLLICISLVRKDGHDSAYCTVRLEEIII